MMMTRKAKVLVLTLFVLFFSISVFAGIKEDIYPKLKCCNCGKPFGPCSCAHANEIKAYIDALIEVGLNEEDILEKIAKKYTLDTIINDKAREIIKKRLIAQAGEIRPEIIISPLSYDLGTVSKSKGELELKVKIQNKGKDVLKITDLKTSCGCVTVKLTRRNKTSLAFGTSGAGPGWEAVISPGEIAELSVIFDLNHESIGLGHMLRNVKIKSNDPLRPVITVEFHAQIAQ